MAVSLNKVSKKVASKAGPKVATPGDVFQLEIVSLDLIKDYGDNAKLHTPAQIDGIIKSITEFGFRDPIAVDSNYEIVEGHGRVAALRKMGALSVPALVFSNLSPAQIKAYRIAHNQLTLSTGFDIGMLSSELHGLVSSGFDIDLTGFSSSDMESFDLQIEMSAPTTSVADGQELASITDSKSGSMVAESKTEMVPTSYQYVIIFDNEEQHALWGSYLKWLKKNVDGDTIAERLVTHSQYTIGLDDESN